MGAARRGFTLFEVAVSLLLVATTIVALVMILPMGIRAQENARYRVHAAALLNGLMVGFVHSDRQPGMHLQRNGGTTTKRSAKAAAVGNAAP